MRPILETCLSPALIGQHDLSGKTAVVIDVFRATTTIVTALESGIAEVRPVLQLQEAFALASEDYLPAAERDGNVAEGFEYGNSPLQYRNLNGLKGKRLALTTTNGTRCVALSQDAEEIVAGALRNRSAVARYLLATGRDAVLFCAGWKDRPNLEDTLLAGALTEALIAHFACGDDATWSALTLWEAARSDLSNWARRTSHYKRLVDKGMREDVLHCLELDNSQVVPVLRDGVFVVE
jgi:2-phosphosulfolactate phosphatase